MTEGALKIIHAAPKANDIGMVSVSELKIPMRDRKL